MKIKDLNNTIINAMIQTGTVIDCKEGYMEVSQQNLSEPTLTISVPSTVTVGTPTTITVTASVVGDITVYINQEYYQTSIGQSTMSFTYTPEDTFTIEAYFSSTQGISINTSQEVVLIDFTPAVQSFNPLGDNYNDVFQEWLYNNGYSEHEEYTTMEEALNVEEIPNNAFDNNTSLTHMDELQYFTNLTSIGESAFGSCTGLTSAIIPNSVTFIDDIAFWRCLRLTNLTIGNSVTTIGSGAFAYCTGLTSVTIPNSVTSIDNDAFSYCSSLTSITIPSSVTSIGESAFWYCTGLTNIIIPNGITRIKSGTFYHCEGLTSFTIPSGVTYIGDTAFQNCTGLTIINIPNSVTTIKRSVFAGCTGLTSVTIPNSITTVPTGMFAGCTGLTSVIIPNSIREIGGGAFQDCTSLYRIYCYVTTPPYVNDYAFQNVPRSATIYVPQGSGNAYRNADIWEEFNIEEMPEIPDSWAIQSSNPAGEKYNPALQVWAKANGYSAENDYTTKTEAQAVTMIEANAFNNNTNLTNINELQYFTNLSIINDYAFRGTSNLTTGILPPSVTDIYVGAFQNSGIQALNPRMPYDSTDYTKGASNVTASNVSRYAFAGCANLTSVTFGSNTTTVGASAFEGCLSLRNVYGEDSGWISVQNNTFKNCPMLKNIYLPSTVTMLLNNVVDGCTELEAIWCYATTPPSVTASTFTNMAADVILYVPYELLSAYQSSSWANYFSSILPISTPVTYACQSIDANGANYNPALQEYLYSKGIASNSGYTTESEALNLYEIADRGLADKTNLTSLANILSNFPNLNKIGNEAFEGCTNLTYADIPSTVIHFGSNVFANCSSLGECHLDQSQITSLGVSTFIDCSALTTVTLPSTLTSIGNGSFVYCNSLTSIYCYATTPPTLGSNVFIDKSNIRLYVPSASVSAYRNASGWDGFRSYNAI